MRNSRPLRISNGDAAIETIDTVVVNHARVSILFLFPRWAISVGQIAPWVALPVASQSPLLSHPMLKHSNDNLIPHWWRIANTRTQVCSFNYGHCWFTLLMIKSCIKPSSAVSHSTRSGVRPSMVLSARTVNRELMPQYSIFWILIALNTIAPCIRRRFNLKMATDHSNPNNPTSASITLVR